MTERRGIVKTKIEAYGQTNPHSPTIDLIKSETKKKTNIADVMSEQVKMPAGILLAAIIFTSAILVFFGFRLLHQINKIFHCFFCICKFSCYKFIRGIIPVCCHLGSDFSFIYAGFFYLLRI